MEQVDRWRFVLLLFCSCCCCCRHGDDGDPSRGGHVMVLVVVVVVVVVERFIGITVWSIERERKQNFPVPPRLWYREYHHCGKRLAGNSLLGVATASDR